MLTPERNPSLYFRWLNHDKDDSYPLLMFTDQCSYGGEYYPPCGDICIVYETEVSLSRGLIVVGTNCAVNKSIRDESDTIAHEYRHHVQYINGWQLDSIGWNPMSTDNYEEAIFNYFTESRAELDALKYAYNKSRSCLSQYWLDILYRWSRG